MKKKRKEKKEKIKIVYRTRPSTDNYNERTKEEIKELEAKRSNVGKGVGGFLRKMALNKQISDKRGAFVARDKLRATKAETEYGKALLEKEKVKIELNALKKKSQVNFDSLYKNQGY